MNTINNTQALLRKFEPLIKDLTSEELLFLNKMIADRIRLINKATAIVSMANLNVGDCVSWHSKYGVKMSGVIIRLNQKTASVRTQANEYWNVSPQLLIKES